MTRFENSYKPPMFMALLFAALLAVGGIGRVFAAVAPGICRRSYRTRSGFVKPK